MNAFACSVLARPNAEFAVHERVAVSIETGEVHLPVSREQVIRTYRQGDDLLVEAADGRLLVVDGYFADDSTADGPVLLTTEGPEGKMALLEIDADGMAVGAQPTALGRLDEMFGVVGDSAEESLQMPDAMGLQEADSELNRILLVGGTVTLAALALASGSDGDGGDPAGAARGRINSGSASLDDWSHFGVEVAAEASAADRENLLSNLMDTVAELSGDGQSLTMAELERIGYAVERASTVNVDMGTYARVVSVDFDLASPPGAAGRSLGSPRNTHDDHDSLSFGVDTNGDGTADQTASFATEDGYRPVGARFFDGTTDNGSPDESHQYHYRDENELAVRADIDGAGAGDANGTVDRVERDTNGDGRADSAVVSANDDGTISSMELVGSDSPAQTAALARINDGSATWDDFRTAGIDVHDLTEGQSRIDSQDMLDVLAIARATGIAGQDLSLLQIQGLVSLMHYNVVLRSSTVTIDTVANTITAVDQTGSAALGDTDEWQYEEWDFANLGSNMAEFSTETGTSDQFPSQLDPELIYQLDFTHMLGFRQISANIDFDANGAYDVRYIGEYREEDGEGGNYVFVAAELMAGGTYDIASSPSADLNLGEILDIGHIESITLHADPTEFVVSLQSLYAWAGTTAGESGREIRIHGDNNDRIVLEPSIQPGDHVTIDGETFAPYAIPVPGGGGEVMVTFYVDTEISVA